MDKQKVGIGVFLIGAVYLLIASGGGGWFIKVSYAQVAQTSGLMDDVIYFVWSFSGAFASILATVGILLYVQAKGSRIALFVIDLAVIWFFAGFYLYAPGVTVPHYSSLYGVSGAIILVFFLAILWLWAKTRTPLEGPAKTAAIFQLVGYEFFLLAAWYLCSYFSTLFKWASITSPVNIIFFIVAGWLFLFLSHYWEFSSGSTMS